MDFINPWSDQNAYDNTSWGDLLTGYDGKTISSDPIGNTTNDGVWTYNWEHGRQLAGVSGTIQYPSASIMPLPDKKNGPYT